MSASSEGLALGTVARPRAATVLHAGIVQVARAVGRISARAPAERHGHLAASGLFDAAYYLAELAARGHRAGTMSPVEHYAAIGDALGVPPHPLFDAHHYRETYPDIAGSGMSGLGHYLEHGAREGRSPHPLFDVAHVTRQVGRTAGNPLLAYIAARPGTVQPHPDFDEAYVLRQRPAFAEAGEPVLASFLRAGGTTLNPSRDFDSFSYVRAYPETRALNPFYHFVRYGRREGRSATPVAVSLGAIVGQVMRAAALDADVLPPHTDVFALGTRLSLDGGGECLDLFRALKAGLGAGGVSRVFFLPEMRIGGAERVLANIVDGLLRLVPGETIGVVVTDSAEPGAEHWLPRHPGVRIVNVHDRFRACRREDALRTVASYLQVCGAKDVYALNSHVGWSLFETHGNALSACMRLHGFAFCYDYDAHGRRAGYAWTHLRQAIRHLSSVITDNTRLPVEFARDLRLTPRDAAKFVVLFQPAEAVRDAAGESRPPHDLDRLRRPCVLWAGRFHRQKNLPLAVEVARLLPDVDFVFAGGGAGSDVLSGVAIPPNAAFTGPYDGFRDLPAGRAQALLHTAEWDGLPNVLLEAAAAGIPLVARSVGGVPDLVNDATGWAVPADAGPAAFADALRAVLSDARERERRLSAMRSCIERRHTPAAFTAALSAHLRSLDGARA